MNPRFSIVIPTRGDFQSVQRLMQSLSRLTGIEEAEVLIVLNPPSPKLDSLSFPSAKWQLKILTSKKGVNEARNQGIKESRGSLIFFFDDDCEILDVNFLCIHEKHHAERPEILALGGHYVSESKNKLAQAYNEIQRDWLIQNRNGLFGESSVLLGGNFSIKRKNPMPLFDPSIQYGGSETEFFLRLGKEGHRFLQIDLPVLHNPDIDLKSFARKARLQGRTHRRLAAAGLTSSQRWVKLPKQNLEPYLTCYKMFFHQEFFIFNPGRFLKVLRYKIAKLHSDLCFYLSNRDLF